MKLFIVTIILLLPSVCFADTIKPEETSMWLPVLAESLPWVVTTLLLPAVAWLSKKLAGLIDRNIETKLLSNALTLVNVVVSGVVTSLSQEMADAFREAASDGRLTTEEKDKLKTLALNRIKSLLISGDTWSTLVGAFGSEEKVEEFVSGEIEKSVRFTKEVSKLVTVKPIKEVLKEVIPTDTELPKSDTESLT